MRQCSFWHAAARSEAQRSRANSRRGTLCLYNNGKPQEIDDDVSYLLYVYDTKDPRR